MEHWYAWIFFVFAAVGWAGFYLSARRREGTRMFYAFVMMLVWIAGGLWAGGFIK